MPRPPRSTLFPYTTLFRSTATRCSRSRGSTARATSRAMRRNRRPSGEPPRRSLPPTRTRSEEHTSELQSLAYLVCRLLLEKKNPHDANELGIVEQTHASCL